MDTNWSSLSSPCVRDLSLDKIAHLFVQTFESLNLISHLHIDKQVLTRFFFAIAGSYRHQNPYHNFYHAAQVFQGCSVALSGFSLCSYFTYIDQFSLLIAAICHDVDHPGVSNSFMRAKKHPLAVYHDDISVLEHHHIAYCFSLLTRFQETDFRRPMNLQDRQAFHHKFVKTILATDMEKSSDLMDSLKKSRRSPDIEPPEKCKETEDLLLCAILHCMDISNPLLCPPSNLRWASLVSAEFSQEKKLMEANNIQIPPFYNLTKVQQQLSFMKNCVLPRWNILHSVTGKFSEVIRQGQQNCEDLETSTDDIFPDFTQVLMVPNGAPLLAPLDMNFSNHESHYSHFYDKK